MIDKKKMYYYKILSLILKKYKFEDIAMSVNLSIEELLSFIEESKIAAITKVPLYIEEGGPKLIYHEQQHDTHYVKTVNSVLNLMLTSDWHLDHKDDRIDLINYYYEMAAKKNVQFIINLGDYLNGPISSFLFKNQKLNSFSKQKMQKIAKVQTGNLEGNLNRLKQVHCSDFLHYFITGNHDLYFIEHDSVNIGEEIKNSSDNLKFLGNCLSYLQINDFRITVSHGNYEDIKRKANYLERINFQKQYPYLTKNKPHLVAQAHFHFGQELLSRQVKSIQIPCLKTCASNSAKSKSNRIALPGVVFLKIFPLEEEFEVEYEAVYAGEKEIVIKKELKIKK